MNEMNNEEQESLETKEQPSHAEEKPVETKAEEAPVEVEAAAEEVAPVEVEAAAEEEAPVEVEAAAEEVAPVEVEAAGEAAVSVEVETAAEEVAPVEVEAATEENIPAEAIEGISLEFFPSEVGFEEPVTHHSPSEEPPRADTHAVAEEFPLEAALEEGMKILDAASAEVSDVPAIPDVPIVSDDAGLRGAMEAILFAAEKPVSLLRFREVFGEEGPTDEELTRLLAAIAERHDAPESGVALRQTHGGWQFTTRKEQAPYVTKFLAMKPFRLGRSSLEVMAIVAYRQPVTRAEIDQIRGIDSSHLLRTLMERGLVRMAGKADAPGRPVQYGTSPKFLEVLGLPSLNDLPPLSELAELKGDTPDPISVLEAGLDRFLEETPTREDVQVQATEGLDEIQDILEKADAAPQEVFGSQEEQDISRSNQEALLAFQETMKPRRRNKKSVSFEELTTGTADVSAANDGTDGAEAVEFSDVAPDADLPELPAVQELPLDGPPRDSEISS